MRTDLDIFTADKENICNVLNVVVEKWHRAFRCQTHGTPNETEQ